MGNTLKVRKLRCRVGDIVKYFTMENPHGQYGKIRESLLQLDAEGGYPERGTIVYTVQSIDSAQRGRQPDRITENHIMEVYRKDEQEGQEETKQGSTKE